MNIEWQDGSTIAVTSNGRCAVVSGNRAGLLSLAALRLYRRMGFAVRKRERVR